MKFQTNMHRRCFAAVLLLLLHSAIGAEFPANADVARQAQQILNETTTTDGPGAAILVARGDEVIFRGARGMAQMELGVALRADHVFRIGSNTKQFAAATILKLIEQGRLSLADPLSKFLPDYPSGSKITVHELLNHTSGIKDYTEIDGYFRAAIREDLDTAKLVAVFKDQPVDFAPGTNWKYDNSGYVLIGAIIEKVTGKSWHEAIRETVLAPLALKHTGYGADQPLIAGRVAGYSTDEQGHASNTIYISMTQPGAAGAMVSSVDDMFHWLRALHTDKVLKAESYQQMITPVPTPSGKPTDYGYGIFTRMVRGEHAFGHGGGIPGFTSDTLYIPGPAITVVALTNTDSGHPDVQLITAKLAASALGRAYPTRHPITLTAAQMQELTGSYKLDGDGRRTIGVSNGKLYTQRVGGPAHELLASSVNELYLDAALDYFTVTRDDTGKVIAIEQFPNGEAPSQHQARVGKAASD